MTDQSQGLDATQEASLKHAAYHRKLKVAVEQAQQRPRQGGGQARGPLVEQVVAHLQVLPQPVVQLLRHKARCTTLRGSSS